MSLHNKQSEISNKELTDQIDVIVVTYYTGEVLFTNIKAILSLHNLHRLIVVNNGNSPEAEAKLKNLALAHQNLKLLSGHGNVGFAHGCNLGAEQSSGQYLLFLNPDCIINDQDTLIKLQQAILSKSDYKAATCKILNKDGSIQKTCRRNLLSPQIAISESFNLYKIFLKLPSLNLPIQEIANLPKISPVPALSGAVIFVEAKFFENIGGFDEQYFLHVEDMDFCMQIYISGYKIAFVRDLTIKHLLSTSDVTSKFLEKHKAKGFIIYIQKYFPLFRKFPINLIFKFLVYLRYFIKIYLKPDKY